MSYYITRNILKNYKNRTVHIEGYIEKFGYKDFDGYSRLIDVDILPRQLLLYNMPEIKYPIKYIVEPDTTTLLNKVIVVNCNIFLYKKWKIIMYKKFTLKNYLQKKPLNI